MKTAKKYDQYGYPVRLKIKQDSDSYNSSYTSVPGLILTILTATILLPPLIHLANRMYSFEDDIFTSLSMVNGYEDDLFKLNLYNLSMIPSISVGSTGSFKAP